jgi:hypothetical protein
MRWEHLHQQLSRTYQPAEPTNATLSRRPSETSRTSQQQRAITGFGMEFHKEATHGFTEPSQTGPTQGRVIAVCCKITIDSVTSNYNNYIQHTTKVSLITPTPQVSSSVVVIAFCSGKVI